MSASVKHDAPHRVKIPMQVGKLLPLLASDRDGEVVATARAICRTLGGAGLNLHDLAVAITTISDPVPIIRQSEPFSFFDLSRAVRDMDRGRLTRQERGFVLAMCSRGSRPPSPRQAAWLNDLHARLCRRAAA